MTGSTKALADRWWLLEPLGSGGMSTVYRASSAFTGAPVAVKLLHPHLDTSREMVERFKQEAIVTARLASDHIVRVYDAGLDPDRRRYYLVMELLEGDDLQARLAARGRFSSEAVVELLRQVAYALEATHGAGVVHRDLEPSNLFVVRRDDGSPCVKVIDFGIAKIVASHSQAVTTLATGTPAYMAPEQIRGAGDIGPAADLHALGHIAYTLLVGHCYWEHLRRGAKVFPLLRAVGRGPDVPASARAAEAGVILPEGFDAWFARATAVSPDARFETAHDQIAALGEALRVSVAPEIEPWW